MYLDGIVLKRSWAGEVTNVSLLVAIAVNEDGYREILGITEGAKEDKTGWMNFLRHLRERGLKGTQLFITDKCLGLVESLTECFSEAKWQRCTVHFYRNIFSVVPNGKVREVAAMLKAIHAQEDLASARLKATAVISKLKGMRRNVRVDRVNQVWSTDITYIRLRHGFVYLCAIIDWYSRYVLAWRLSTTLDSSFCVDALREALQKYGKPEIFNSDQGTQFTCKNFTDILKENDIAISMDGRGRALDNVFVERLWRTVKYEDVFLKDYGDVKSCRQGLSDFFERYNNRREHQSLNYYYPVQIYNNEIILKKAA